MEYGDAHRYLRACGGEFRQARKERGLTREELAELAGVHVNSIGIAERGDHDQNVMVRTKLYAALGCCHVEINRECFRIVLNSGSDAFPDTEILSMPCAAIAFHIGQAIRIERECKGVTLQELSRAGGIHLNTLWNIERGLVSATTLVLYRIFRALDVMTLKAGTVGLSLL